MSQSTTSIPSRSGPLGVFAGGLILLVIAALSVWVLPQVLVFNQQMQQMDVEYSPDDFYNGELQSGQSTDIPEGFMVNLQPESMWANMDPMSTEPPPMPACTVEGPSGPLELLDVYGQASFETVETGSYKVECEGGGMIYLNGSKADEYHQQQGWARTMSILSWTSWIALVGGILLSVAGAYLLGERNVERKLALEKVYADVPGYAPIAAPDGAPAAPAAGSGAAPAASAPGAASGPAQPGPAQPQLPPVTRPKNSRQSRDPFAD